MPSIYDLLANQDPEQLKKLMDIRNEVPLNKYASESAKIFEAAPRSAAESAQTFLEGIPESVPKVSQEVPLAKYAKDSARVFEAAPRSAAESAETFMKALPEGIAEGKEIVPYSQLAKIEAPSMLSKVGRVAGKAAGPAGLLYELLKGTPAGEGEDAEVAKLRQMGGVDPSEHDIPPVEPPAGPSSLFGDASKATQNALMAPEEAAVSAPNPELSAMRDLMAKASGEAPVSARMNTSDAISQLLNKNKADLADATGQRDQRRLFALLNDAANTVGSALTPMGTTKPDQNFTNTLLKQAETPISDLALKQSQEGKLLEQMNAKRGLALQDPNSQESINFRKAVEAVSPEMKKVYGDQFENITAADKDNIQEFIKLKETLASRKLAQEQLNLSKSQKRDVQASQEASKLAQRFTDKLAADKASSRTALGKAQLKIQSAEAIEALVSNYKNLDQVDTRQMYEIASSLDSLLKSGAATISGIEHLVPKNARVSGAKMLEWIKSKPEGAGQGAFIKRMLEGVKREKDVAQKQIQEYNTKTLPGFKRLKELDPDWYNEIVKTYNLDPASLSKAKEEAPEEGKSIVSKDELLKARNTPGEPRSQQLLQVAKREDDDAVKWAQANPTDPRSAKILSMHGLQ